MELKDIGEFGLISRLTKDSIFNYNEVIFGIGDDAAVLPFDGENYLLAACDMLIEDVHFLYNKSTPFQIGYKAVAVNFSDIAAMGGWPTGVLVSIGFPPNTPLNELDQAYAGIKNICQKYGVNIVGGDTVSSPQKWVINVSVLGRVKKEHLRLRSQAKVNDIVVVTGPLGDAAAGLELVLHQHSGVPRSLENKLLCKHLIPEPCLKESKILNSEMGLHALNDISDGLASETREIAEASKVGIELQAEKIPLSKESIALGNLLNKDPLQWALFGGEDFQLIGTIAPESFDRLQNIFFKKLGKPLYEIGVVTKELGVQLVQNKKSTLLKGKGYNHFS